MVSKPTLTLLLFVGIFLSGTFVLACNETWVMTAAGGFHTLAIAANGTLMAWGRNDQGQLGINNGRKDELNPVVVLPGMRWKFVAAGNDTSYAIREDGTLWAFGNNEHAMLGDGTRYQRHFPIQVGNESGWTKVAPGDRHVLALKRKKLFAWGTNDYGRLGLGNNYDQLYPAPVWSAQNLIDIAAGYQHSLAVTEEWELYSWGSNLAGQGGHGHGYSRFTTPEKVHYDEKLRWKAVAARDNHSLALTTEGKLYAFGSHMSGVYVINQQTQTIAKPVGNFTWREIKTESKRTIGIMENGTLWVWDYLTNKRTSPQAEKEMYAPSRLANDSKWKSISAGWSHSVALSENGVMFAWGDNQFGQLGVNSTDDIESPAVCPNNGVCHLNRCQNSPCPSGFFNLLGVCERCSVRCLECSGSATNCTKTREDPIDPVKPEPTRRGPIYVFAMIATVALVMIYIKL